MPRDERGQSTVELALCLPIVALLLAGVVETGGLLIDHARLWHAAREAARVAVVDPREDVVAEAAQRSGLQDLEISIDPEAVARRQGDPLTVTLRYSPSGRVPFVGELLEQLELTADVTMRIEQP